MGYLSVTKQEGQKKHIQDVIKAYARVHNLDASKYDWEKTKSASPRWDFIRTSHSQRATSKRDDKITKFINIVMASMIFVSVVLMIAVLEHGYDRASASYVANPAVDVMKVMGSVLTVALIILSIIHRLRIFRLRLAQCGTTLNVFSLKYTVHVQFILQLFLEVLVYVPHPIPFLTAAWANKLGLLVFLRIVFCLRTIRDHLPIYNKRHLIWKVPRLLMYADEESFTILMAVRYVFNTYGGYCIVIIVSVAGTIFPFSLMVAEREAQPDIGYGLWVFYCFNTMTTVGYGDFAAATVLGQVIVSPMMAMGLVLWALAVNVLSIWLNTTEQEEQVVTWLADRKSSKTLRETSAFLIQVTWRYNRYKRERESRNERIERHVRQTAEAKQARYSRELRALRLERDWKLLHAFNPLYTDIDTLLGYAQDTHFNTSNLCHCAGIPASTKCVDLTSYDRHTNCNNPHCQPIKLRGKNQPQQQQEQPTPHPQQSQQHPPHPQSPHLQSPQFAAPQIHSPHLSTHVAPPSDPPQQQQTLQQLQILQQQLQQVQEIQVQIQQQLTQLIASQLQQASQPQSPQPMQSSSTQPQQPHSSQLVQAFHPSQPSQPSIQQSFVFHPMHLEYLRKYTSPAVVFPPKHIMLLHSTTLPPHPPHSPFHHELSQKKQKEKQKQSHNGDHNRPDDRPDIHDEAPTTPLTRAHRAGSPSSPSQTKSPRKRPLQIHRDKDA